jgi:FAD/FMN-containing dehydrogenase
VGARFEKEKTQSGAKAMTGTMKRLNGGTTNVPEVKSMDLKSSLRGRLIGQADAGYDDARALWNGMMDRRPAAIIQAHGTRDIQLAVNFARGNDLLLAIKSGGHQIAGHAVADGALLLDLSQMCGVHVDPDKATARVEPGCLFSDVDQETQLYGLALPLGINSTTGVAGLTLGGGFGWITGKHGLTIDNLRCLCRWRRAHRQRRTERRSVLGYPRRGRKFRCHLIL